MKKRLLCVLLLSVVLVSLAVTPTGAAVYAGRALDENWILYQDSSSDSFFKPNGEAVYWEPTDEEKKGMDEDDVEAYRLAPYYHIQYHLDTDSGELHIFCGKDENGETVYETMLPYANVNWVPWMKSDQKKYIKTAYIEDGVQSVGRFSFFECPELKEVYIPHTVQKINRVTFYNCYKLEHIYYAGNRADFLSNIRFEESFNGIMNFETGRLKSGIWDLLHYGESVGVVCKNQEGQTFATYTVGGYFVGDEYKIVPNVYEGMTYVGEKSEITGKFKKGDKTVYVLDYVCDHEYTVADPTKPCGCFCAHCGQPDLHPAVEHTWGEPKVISKRGLFTPQDEIVKCEVCEAGYEIYKRPYIFYIAIGASGVAVVAAVTFAIVIPLRRRKRLKDLTW